MVRVTRDSLIIIILITDVFQLSQNKVVNFNAAFTHSQSPHDDSNTFCRLESPFIYSHAFIIIHMQHPHCVLEFVHMTSVQRALSF